VLGLDFATFKDLGDLGASPRPLEAVLDGNLAHEVLCIGKRSEFEVGEPRPARANVSVQRSAGDDPRVRSI